MPNLSDEEQCMLSLMEIANFPMEVKHGLFMYNRGLEMPNGYEYSNAYKSTSDFTKVCMLFERWKRNNDKN
jgi:hypothetical protein